MKKIVWLFVALLVLFSAMSMFTGQGPPGGAGNKSQDLSLVVNSKNDTCALMGIIERAIVQEKAQLPIGGKGAASDNCPPLIKAAVLSKKIRLPHDDGVSQKILPRTGGQGQLFTRFNNRSGLSSQRNC